MEWILFALWAAKEILADGAWVDLTVAMLVSLLGTTAFFCCCMAFYAWKRSLEMSDRLKELEKHV